jgi:hypothetical protein
VPAEFPQAERDRTADQAEADDVRSTSRFTHEARSYCRWPGDG